MRVSNASKHDTTVEIDHFQWNRNRNKTTTCMNESIDIDHDHIEHKKKLESEKYLFQLSVRYALEFQSLFHLLIKLNSIYLYCSAIQMLWLMIVCY